MASLPSHGFPFGPHIKRIQWTYSILRAVASPQRPAEIVGLCRMAKPIQFTAPGKLIGERHNRAADPQEAVPSLGPGDVAHLRLGNVQQPGKLRPVRRRLIQQDQKLTVGKHEPGRVGPQTFLHVLRRSSHGRSVFPKPLPAFVEELGAVVILEKQVDFVQEYRPGRCCP